MTSASLIQRFASFARDPSVPTPFIPTLPPHLLLFGDSLTDRSALVSGWASVLSSKYTRRMDIVVRGYGGYNSRDALQVLPIVLKPYTTPEGPRLNLVVVCLGANDSALPEEDLGTPHSARQHVSVASYTANIEKIVRMIQSAQEGVKVLLVTPPAVHDETRRNFMIERIGQEAVDLLPAGTLDRRNDNTRLYAEACQKVAKDLGIPWLDLWTAFQKTKDWGTVMFEDGLHFTNAGQLRMGELVFQRIVEEFEELRPDNLKMSMPFWEDVTGELAWGKRLLG